MPTRVDGTKVPCQSRVSEGKTFHTAATAFLDSRWRESDFVLNGRMNFNPRRWWSSKCATHTALARSTRDEVGSLLPGPTGTLGISNEISADLGTERRTTTKAPPAEIFRAVANSSESLPLASRERTKIGIASRKRTDFLASLRGTRFFTFNPCVNTLRLRTLGAKHGTSRMITGRSSLNLAHRAESAAML